jgi:hypothetical protein
VDKITAEVPSGTRLAFVGLLLALSVSFANASVQNLNTFVNKRPPTYGLSAWPEA